MTFRKKSQQMRELEARLGKPIEQIVPETYNAHQSIAAAAAALGVPAGTFGWWLMRMGLRVNTEKVARVAA